MEKIRRGSITIKRNTGEEFNAMTAVETLRFRNETNERLDAIEKQLEALKSQTKKKVNKIE